MSPAGRLDQLHPSELRGYRELYMAAQQLAVHWSRLREPLAGSPAAGALEAGVATGRRLLAELAEVTPEYELYGTPAARGLGVRVGELRNAVCDRFLERNQALRLAVLDVQHLATLAAYLGVLAEQRGDDRQVRFCMTWRGELEQVEAAVRSASVALGKDPQAAIAPLDDSVTGRVAHRLAWAVGTLGEWTDRQFGRRGSQASVPPRSPE